MLSNCDADQSSTENGITGDTLVLLNQEELREIGINSVGHRLAILKAVYQLKVNQNIPIESDHYVPPCTFARLCPTPIPHLTCRVAETVTDNKPVGVDPSVYDRLLSLIDQQSPLAAPVSPIH